MYKGQKNKWIAFCGSDSIQLEIEYRSISSQPPRSRSGSMSSSIPVRDGLYIANVKQKICTPTYWEGDPTPIIRGTWFVETKAGVYQPVLEEEAAYIERNHWKEPLQKKLREGQDATDGTRSSKAQREPLFTAESVASNSSSKFVVWYGEDDIWLNTKDITHQVTKSVAGLFGNKKKGELVRAKRLRRGWHTKPDPDDKLPAARHLILVVHGIGQALDSNSIVTCAKGLSETALQELYANATDGNLEDRVEFIPIEWRTSLTLDGGLLDKISPPGISQIRRISQLAVCDILYYMSPLYGSEIVNNVLTTMNRQYRKYVEHHPWFKEHGRVSILAHSLGSVITYDILASQAWGPETQWVGHRPSCGEQLNFPVENFFAIGSPLSLFLGMRGAGSDSKVTGETNPFSLPNAICKRMFNIYHPSDPVAFRWEPLILQKYADVKPVKLSRDSRSSSVSSQTSDSTDGGVSDHPATTDTASSSKSRLFGSIAGAIGTALTTTKVSIVTPVIEI
jgi:phospholipase DDHD1